MPAVKKTTVKAKPVSKKSSTSKASKATRKPKTITKKMQAELDKEISEFEIATQDMEEKNEIPLFTEKDDNLSQEEIEEKSRQISQAIKRPVNFYRKIAFLFIFLTFILLVAVFYFSFVKLTIAISPKQEIVNDNIIIDVKDASKSQDAGQEAVVGLIEQVDLAIEKAFASTGEEIISEEVAGEVTIINTLNVAQPLVATTRLLSSDDKLFRTKKTVTVPANGQVTVDVYADKVSREMAIGPTKFTIPGLRADKQDKIYAESKEIFSYINKTKPFIKQSDIDEAMVVMKKELVSEARQEFGSSYKGYDQVIYSINDNQLELSAGAKAGEEKSEFSVSAKTKVNVIAFNGGDVARKSELRLIAGLSSNKELINFQRDSIIYELNTYDTVSGSATINAFFKGETKIKDGSRLIDAEKLTGLNKDQLNDYLKSFSEIESFQIIFKPSFLKKAPGLADRIEIKIVQ